MVMAGSASQRGPFGWRQFTGLSWASSRATTVATIAAVLLLVGSVWLARDNIEDGPVGDRLSAPAHGVRQRAQVVMATLTEAETGQRGYLLTGDLAYLAPYEDARARLPREFVALQTALRARNGADRRLTEIRALTAAKMAELAETISLMKANRGDDAMRLVRGNSGQRTMAAIRAQIEALAPEVDVERLRNQRRAISIWERVGVVGFGLLASLLLAGVALGQRRARRAASTALAALKRFTHAFGLSHGLLCRLDGTITFWAEGMEHLYGYTASQALGRVSYDLLQTQFPIPLIEIQATVLDRGHWQGELVHRRRDGATVEVASHWALHRGGPGEPDGMIEVNNDITPIRDAQREHERGAALLRTIVEAAPAAIYAKDRDGRLTLANQISVDLMGASWADVEGRTDLELLTDPRQAQAVMTDDRRVMESDRAESLEDVVGEVGGAPRIWFSTKTPLHAPDGKVIGLVGVSVDITEHKAAMVQLSALNAELEGALAERTVVQTALARSEREFRASFESAAVGKVHSHPVTRRIVRVNRAFAQMLGYMPDELAGRNSQALLWPQDRAIEKAAYADSLATGEASFVREKRYRTREGRPIWTRVSTTIVRSETTREPVLAIAVIENIDERHKAQLDLVAAKAELELLVEQRSVALQQRDLLLREVYHRVKNNLQIIDSFLLMQGRQMNDPQAKAAIVSLRGRLFALGLVHHQLMGSANLRTFDIGPFLKDLSTNLADANTGGDVEIVVRADPIDAGLDFAVPLGLLVTELVTNAMKHAFPHGKGRVEIALNRRDDGSIDLMVCDQGRGYDPAAPRERPGLGAGIVHGLVQQLGGVMTVDGRHGTRVDIHMAQL